ncbi:MAG: hypothetical protein WBG90_07575 [Saonia sp.]
MRKSVTAFLQSIGGRSIKAGPIQWKFTAEKIDGDIYRVNATAYIDYPWRLYSRQSETEGPLPTQVEFEESAAVRLLGEPEEIGIFKEEYDTKLKVYTRYSTSVVSFVLPVQSYIRPETIKGKVIFMACTKKRCLNPAKIEFQVALD